MLVGASVLSIREPRIKSSPTRGGRGARRPPSAVGAASGSSCTLRTGYRQPAGRHLPAAGPSASRPRRRGRALGRAPPCPEVPSAPDRTRGTGNSARNFPVPPTSRPACLEEASGLSSPDHESQNATRPHAVTAEHALLAVPAHVGSASGSEQWDHGKRVDGRD